MRLLATLALFVALAGCRSTANASLVDGGGLGRDPSLGPDLTTNLRNMKPEAAQALKKALTAYIRRSMETEARMNVRKLVDSAISYYEEDHLDKTGKVIEKQFPDATPMSPAGSACGKPENKFPVDGKQWISNATWRALHFALDEPHYFRYEFVSSGRGKDATFTARAVGDPDCSGAVKTFERSGTVASGTLVVSGLVITPPEAAPQITLRQVAAAVAQLQQEVHSAPNHARRSADDAAKMNLRKLVEASVA